MWINILSTLPWCARGTVLGSLVAALATNAGIQLPTCASKL
jgi:hypothetical protein